MDCGNIQYYLFLIYLYHTIIAILGTGLCDNYNFIQFIADEKKYSCAKCNNNLIKIL